MAARLELGSIVDDIDVGDEVVTARFERCPAGWQASFELSHPEVTDLSVVHRLTAESLAEAKTAVPHAVTYLRGCPVDEPLYDDPQADTSLSGTASLPVEPRHDQARRHLVPLR